MHGVPNVELATILIAFIPGVAVLLTMRAWSLNAGQALWANLRMVAQLLAVGYVLTYVLKTNNPLVVAAVIVVMITVAAWIACRPLKAKSARTYLIVLASISASGLLMLLLVSQFVVQLPRWFEPSFVVPIAGMIFANSMNTVSLTAERFEAESGRGAAYVDARRTALDAALIPQINALMAVGLVSLPGMMTGQILSGVDPLIAVRYQIVVMFMIFGSAGLAAIGYLVAIRTR